jgi:hypothetical protein
MPTSVISTIARDVHKVDSTVVDSAWNGLNNGSFYSLFGTHDIHVEFIEFLRGEFEVHKLSADITKFVCGAVNLVQKFRKFYFCRFWQRLVSGGCQFYVFYRNILKATHKSKWDR